MVASPIPIISFKKFLANPEVELERTAWEIDHALTTCGLFFLEEHGVDWSISENCLRDLNTFFELPVEKKRIYQCTSLQHGRGFLPFESQNINAYMGRLGYPNDASERFSFGRVRPRFGNFTQDASDFTDTWSPNIYSDEPKTFRKSVENFYEAMDNLSLKFMRIFSFLLGLESDYFEKRCANASHMLKFSYYPVVKNPLPRQDRISLHTDIVPFTVLLSEHSKEGLRALTVQGDWIPVEVPPDKNGYHIRDPRPQLGCFIVLTGDCMEILTNKHYAALLHLVTFPSDMATQTARASVGFFPQMNGDDLLETAPKFLDENQKSNYDPILYKDMYAKKYKNMYKADKTFDNFKMY